tara:strand:+ start:8183 stop:8470 length:288 start_codon:yes stop_codon:yes gene_type:complete
MIFHKIFNISLSFIFTILLTSCSKANVITELFNSNVSCDEPKPYQSVVEQKRVSSPDGLDQLDKTKELYIPELENVVAPSGSKCVEYPPAIGEPN